MKDKVTPDDSVENDQTPAKTDGEVRSKYADSVLLSQHQQMEQYDIPLVTSPSIVHVGTALATAQQEIRPVFAESHASFYDSQYADLTAVREGIRTAFGNAGLAVVQCPCFNTNTGFVEVTTMIIHGKSGEYIQSTLAMKPEKPGPQAIGSCTTYAKRYSLASMAGVVSSTNRLACGLKEDDDGESATTDPKTNPSGMKKPTAKNTKPRQRSKKKGAELTLKRLAAVKQQKESSEDVSASSNVPEKASEPVGDEKQPEPPLGGSGDW